MDCSAFSSLSVGSTKLNWKTAIDCACVETSPVIDRTCGGRAGRGGGRRTVGPEMAAGSGLQEIHLWNILNEFTALKLTQRQIREIVLKFGVELHKIDDIDDQYREGDRIAGYVQAWLDIDGAPTWQKIIAALILMKIPAKADELAKRVGVEHPTVAPVVDPLSVFSYLELTQQQIRELFRRLGVKENKIRDIDDEYGGSDRVAHYVQAWRDIDSEASYPKISAALILMGLQGKSDALTTRLAKDEVFKKDQRPDLSS